MKWTIGFDALTESAFIQTDSEALLWISFVREMSGYTESIRKQNDIVFIPIRVFLRLRKDIAQFIANHREEISINYTKEIREKLSVLNKNSYRAALHSDPYTQENVKEKLNAAGFLRPLTQNQLNNICQLGPLPAGATFSVPGAGKTTEALAYFFINARKEDKLLVVAPKNAFGAWEEQLNVCMGDLAQPFIRLRGGYSSIDRLLRDNPRFMLITYQQFPRVLDLIKKFLEKNHVYMFLDESHRIKSGLQGVTPEAVLSCSYLPERKLIMSGTPMPQSISDLIPQFTFLYPDHSVTSDTVVDCIQPIYVRTTKAQLELPEIQRITVTLDMSTLQREIYTTLKSEIKRQIIPLLSDSSRLSLRELGKKITKVMQFVSNPALLAADMNYLFDPKIGELLARNEGPKIEYACKRAEELASEGKKVIIWSQFVRNVEIISERLRHLGADYIHGGVDAGDEEENDTREWKIKEFHNNPSKRVLVANPAAASEGISLHMVCHNAIYVDRSFNAAHYLQSEDRIHRLGLPYDQTTTVEIIECRNTIDQLVDRRLKRKINIMAESLNDPSLVVDTVHYDPDIGVDDTLSPEDIEEIKKYFEGDEP